MTTLMIQGTCSDAGKSTVVAALCRVFSNAGYRVAPFKAQNMSNNAAVVDGGEIGRAQAVQARAARVEPTVDMNPVLLKPQSDRTSQIVVRGKAWRTADAREYYARKSELWPTVTASLDRLRATHDLVIIEGAGSPAEINLAQYDIVNMRVARYANAPVLLVGDIDRGGVFASLYGTHALLAPEERALIRGFIINKFRGDPSLLTPGFAMLEQRTGVPTLGVLPYLDLGDLPAEDGLAIDARGRLASAHRGTSQEERDTVLDIVVVRLPRIANLDEFQPLANEPGVTVRFVRDTSQFGHPDLVIIPGTKSTMGDLAWMRERGLDRAIVTHRERARPVLGICGGFQMLGHMLRDPNGVDGSTTEMQGLGLLPVTTTFEDDKITERVHGRVAAPTALTSSVADTESAHFEAYEIHMGRTRPLEGESLAAPFSVRAHDGAVRGDGAVSGDGFVVGTYLHGLLEDAALRWRVVDALAARTGVSLSRAHRDVQQGAHGARVDAAFDALAHAATTHLDMRAIAGMIGLSLTFTHDE